VADTSPLIVEPLDLEALIAETVAWQVAEGGDRPQLDLAGELPLICLDPGRARHLLKNLLAMMTRATGSEHPVRVRTSREAGVVLDLTVNTRGQGPEACFGAGASLGIESARRIVEAHGGTFQIAFGAASGARVRIVFMETTAR
jgi:nitrogen fixation/metabolism regulation signal transduction histidine kinase